MTRTALVAIGGNSLITDSKHPDVAHQWAAVHETCRHLADMVETGWQLVITHGNGPQVGFILRRNELAAGSVHTTPLDLIGADTQGAIGYMLQQALGNELTGRGIHTPVVSVVTQVLVDQSDPAFAHPTKPIGGFMTETEARRFEGEGWQVIEDAGRGWRRVVASPEPLQIIEEEPIRDLLAAGCIVVAVGGGGIPVVHEPSLPFVGGGSGRGLKGVYAVIDKDRASCLLARRLKVDLFLISTGVERVALHFNTPHQQELAEMTVAQAEVYMAEGHFKPGSMKPKIEAVMAFTKETGHPSLITSPYQIARALRGETGTRITMDNEQ
ncbi:MAG: carbamate kinase [Chloroflexota bacterium]